MVMPSAFVAACDLASVTCTVKVVIPVPVGVPEITPVWMAGSFVWQGYGADSGAGLPFFPFYLFLLFLHLFFAE